LTKNTVILSWKAKDVLLICFLPR